MISTREGCVFVLFVVVILVAVAVLLWVWGDILKALYVLP